MRRLFKQRFFHLSIILLLLFLFGITILTLWYQSKIYTELIIADDVASLAQILEKIDKDCTIDSFDYQQQNYVDFLNVITFEGSEVGTINLKYPGKWKGPYLRDNPTVQGKHYQVVQTQKGYYLAPGNGVKLQNGKVIGKDISLDKNANIDAMIEENGLLSFNGKPLAVKLIIKKDNNNLILEEEYED